VLAGLACRKQVRLPDHLSVAGGPALVKANEFSQDGISGVVFIPPGEKLESASLQLGIILSRKHDRPAALQDWIMAGYRRSPTQQWHESLPSPTEACKVGLGPTTPPRAFAAVHVCQGGSGVSACAEADEWLSDEVVGRCLNQSSACWDAVCTGRFEAWRKNLETVLDDLLRER
jgi:hypothetical protein